MPNFKKYPEFHYTNTSLYEPSIKPQNSPPQKAHATTTTTTTATGSSSLVALSSQVEKYNIGDQERTVMLSPSVDVVTIRVKTNLDDDFIEVDLDRLNTDFNRFKEICIRELQDCVHIGNDYILQKIRKIPNILIRNTNDIRRLKNEQAIEFVFVKSISLI